MAFRSAIGWLALSLIGLVFGLALLGQRNPWLARSAAALGGSLKSDDDLIAIFREHEVDFTGNDAYDVRLTDYH